MKKAVAFIVFSLALISSILGQQSLQFERQKDLGQVPKIPSYELQDILKSYANGYYGAWAWHNKEYIKQTGWQVSPDYQVNQITFVRGVGFVARCVYRRDKGRYMSTLGDPDKDIYKVRMVNVKWLTFNRSELGLLETNKKANESHINQEGSDQNKKNHNKVAIEENEVRTTKEVNEISTTKEIQK
ncbi:MAG: hypothetical protein HYR55_07035 [Acidobacteria bacterium]|nr:hypothetical protein [Acidobacteriota bacterium]MBI3656233.1 hypothetical protein [Acidobacteriota bacterium]